MSQQVFLTYSHADEELAKAFEKWLHWTLKVDCYRANREAGKHQQFRNSIKEGLANCQVAVALVTPNSQISHWVNYEVGYCHGLNVRVFPVVFREAANQDDATQKLKILDDEHHFKWPGEAQDFFDRVKGVLDGFSHNDRRVFDTPENFSFPVDFRQRTEENFIKFLHDSQPFGDRLEVRERFKLLNEFDFSPIVIDPYLEEYCQAVDAAQHKRPIPLATSHRLKLAELLIDQALNRVFATSFVSNDPWFNRPDRFEYVKVNCGAGSRLKDLGRVTRVFIFDDLNAAKSVPDGLRSAMDQMQNSDADLFWIDRDSARKVLQRERHPLVENLLIVDDRWMTRSTGEGHDGEYLTSRTKSKRGMEFDDFIKSFNSLLRESKKIPNPAPSNLLESQ